MLLHLRAWVPNGTERSGNPVGLLGVCVHGC